ncbi:MAG: tetratricopeptide repeat protein [Nannocystaceae bacterium]|nr:tetratricopeptide repeat protein [Nannocystaceae bacterium]
MSALSKPVLALLVAGWLADLLSGKDSDVEAGVLAYEAGESETALSHFDAAVDRLGERPELDFDRGLALLAQGETDKARKAFEHASEAQDADVRGSALYEIGNIALDTEDYEGAVTAYIECLKARPEHQNAKWNLEIALVKRAEEEEEEEEEDEEDEEEEDESGESGDEDSGGEDSGGEDSGGEDSGGEDSGGEDSGGEDSGGEDSGGEGSGGEQDPGQGESGGEPPDQPEPDAPEQEPQPEPSPPPKPLSQMDIDKALEELDEQDVFLMDRPTGRPRKPVQDW